MYVFFFYSIFLNIISSHFTNGLYVKGILTPRVVATSMPKVNWKKCLAIFC